MPRRRRHWKIPWQALAVASGMRKNVVYFSSMGTLTVPRIPCLRLELRRARGKRLGAVPEPPSSKTL